MEDALASLAATRAALVPAPDRVADRIRVEVAEARLHVGTQLPEQALAEALQVSRNTVREALSQLIAERVLVRIPNRGVFVARPEPGDVRDLYAARLVLEPGAVLYGQRAGEPEALAAVRTAVVTGRSAAEADDWVGVAQANQDFHREIVALAGSPRLDREMGRLLAEMRLVFQRMPEVRSFHEPYLARNEEITTLLAAAEFGRAAEELTRYLGTARDQLLAAYPHL